MLPSPCMYSSPCRTSFAIVAIRSSSIPSGNLQSTVVEFLVQELGSDSRDSEAKGFASPGAALTGLGQSLQGCRQISTA